MPDHLFRLNQNIPPASQTLTSIQELFSPGSDKSGRKGTLMLTAVAMSARPGAKKALAEIWNAEDRDHARRGVAALKRRK